MAKDPRTFMLIATRHEDSKEWEVATTELFELGLCDPFIRLRELSATTEEAWWLEHLFRVELLHFFDPTLPI